MTALRAVIFDLDGTLLDSAPDILNAVNATLKLYNRPTVSLQDIKSMVGDGLLTTLHRAFERTGAAVSTDQSYRYFQDFIGCRPPIRRRFIRRRSRQ